MPAVGATSCTKGEALTAFDGIHLCSKNASHKLHPDRADEEDILPTMNRAVHAHIKSKAFDAAFIVDVIPLYNYP